MIMQKDPLIAAYFVSNRCLIETDSQRIQKGTEKGGLHRRKFPAAQPLCHVHSYYLLYRFVKLIVTVQHSPKHLLLRAYENLTIKHKSPILRAANFQ